MNWYRNHTADDSAFRPQSMAGKLWDGLYSLLRFTDVYFLEFISAITAIWSWGIILLLPGNTFSASRAYRALAFLPEWFWAAIMITFGLCQLSVVLLSLSAYLYTRIDLLRLRSPRRDIARVGVFLWGSITGMLMIGNFASTAWGTYLLAYTLGNAVVVWRISLQLRK